mmetsp:Transcript_104898/g.301923  ORF Transcript_104898/g.301923 Transcript_104898/m.301923 type:complete len:208 (-) Transcript_104898:705-1328(-)
MPAPLWKAASTAWPKSSAPRWNEGPSGLLRSSSSVLRWTPAGRWWAARTLWSAPTAPESSRPSTRSQRTCGNAPRTRRTTRPRARGRLGSTSRRTQTRPTRQSSKRLRRTPAQPPSRALQSGRAWTTSRAWSTLAAHSSAPLASWTGCGRRAAPPCPWPARARTTRRSTPRNSTPTPRTSRPPPRRRAGSMCRKRPAHLGSRGNRLR